MRAAVLLTCLWPGLAHLWWRGERLGLLAAVAFSAWLNFALASRYVWPELLPAAGNTAVWALLLVFWIAGFCHSVSCWHSLTGKRRDVVAEGLFLRAQAEYLKGHWYEAESLLNKLLQRQPRDLEGRLMLATLMRHTRRFPAAREQLLALGRLEGAGRWVVELQREAILLKRLTEDPELSGLEGEQDQPAVRAA